ncbi:MULTISPECIES: YncE family protein [unclassified Sphingobacterium]|uniref:YncE family protein n=1 Tax=unclassified Sphingobacterium TaxID=2609468 RepID=UPI00104DF03A|nr:MULTISPECIES: WD40 repeat domain-containing protein [unclassified Sphingobacterium]MCS3556250.1 hypothetical protein [Sphingobacterium sp. JUb21]
MKHFIILMITAVLLITACSKSNDNPNPPKEIENKIELNAPVADGESIKLSWSKLTNNLFYNYTILRKDYDTDSFHEIQKIMDNSTTQIEDIEVPYSPEVSYQIVGQMKNGTIISSNVISYKRPGIEILNISPFDVIHSEVDQLLYFFEKTGRISLYDLKTSKVVKQVETNSTIGFADIESYQGKKELYVPRNDGWIFVYDAYTLEKITQITVGLESTCVVSNKNILYVSTSAWINRPLKVYQRSDRRLIEETGDFDRTRFRKIPGTNTSLLEITLNIGPTDQRFYRFDAKGKIETNFSDRYHGDHPLDASVFAFFPNGTKYITGSQGAIYNIDLTYDKSLPRGNLLFTDFCFENNGAQVYAATTAKSIELYQTSDYSYMKSIKTKAYPYRIFNTNQGLIAVSTTKKNSDQYSFNDQKNKVVIEKIGK